jgi:hypothetical protein
VELTPQGGKKWPPGAVASHGKQSITYTLRQYW